MFSLGNLSIKQKLTLIILVTIIAAGLLSAVGIVISDYVIYRDWMQRDLLALAQIVAQNSTAALAFEDPKTASETLMALKAKPHVVSACIYRNNGSTLAKYMRPGVIDACPPLVEREEIQFSSDFVTVWYPVILDNVRLGILFLRYDLEEIYARSRVYGATVLLVLLISGSIVLILSSRLRELVERPIIQLVNATKQVSKTRDYGTRAEKISGDELGVLADAFNEMLANIQSQAAELKAARDELEVRVQERTLELQRELIERRRAEEALQQQTAELARSNADLQQFAYVASHDLQEPLRMVVSYMQIIAEQYKGKLDADADEFIGYAVDGANRMRQLISGLLEYSRAGTRGLQLAPTDCEVILQEVLANLEVSIQESSATVTHAPLPTVMAEHLQMVQLFQNLIGNAIKFRGSEPPHIHVSAKRHNSYWLFSVADNGIGIDPEHHQLIFVIFQRLHGRMEYPGTGIGLAICKKLVERLGGSIWLESSMGKGSTFYFTLPAVMSERGTEGVDS